MLEVYEDRIVLLKNEMKKIGVDALLIPEINKFLNEYTNEEEKRVEYISGLKASAGYVIISENKNAIFVDGRYTTQAKKQTSSKLFDYYNLSNLDIISFLSKNLEKHKKVAIDANLIGHDNYVSLNKLFVENGYELVLLENNLVDTIWNDKPKAKKYPLSPYPLEYAGVNSLEKCHQVGDFIRQNNANSMLITSPENIMWLLNVRGKDVQGATFASCFGVIGADGFIDVFIDLSQVNGAVQKVTPHVRYHEFSVMPLFISNLLSKGEIILAPSDNTPMIFSMWANGNKGKIIFINDYLSELKTQKNQIEIEYMKKANIKDAVHFVNIIHYIKFHALKDKTDEMGIVSKINDTTSQDSDYIEDSFSSIVGIDGNGAIIHYRPSIETSIPIKENSVVLIDRGGQYLYGTTDTTRTISTGNLPEGFKKFYTLVLKGHIALMMAKFPEGTKGFHLDALARQYLWQEGYDYKHGTGHGVGAAGAVHEGPFGIHKLANKNIIPNLIITNEPGAYFENKYGIRIEDDMVVNVKDENGFLSFTSLGYTPFDRESIDKNLLTNSEIKYINDYHKRSYNTLSELIDNTEVLTWFKETTKEI